MISGLRLVTGNRDRRLRAAAAGRPARPVTTIMLVDGDLIAGRTLAQALKFAGYHVRIAPTGNAACSLQLRTRADLIIADLMLPDMDGLALTTTLRSMTDAPIIICSTRCGEVDRALARMLGAADFVAKPYDLDTFVARVEVVMSGVRNDPESAAI